MSQKIDGNNPQVTQSGHIINCHGAATCPLNGANAPESKHQSDFAARTKIWCSPGAREALERLMTKHNFTAPRLHVAWQANSLVWDDERAELVAKTYWVEPLFGYGMAALMLVYFILQGGVFIFTPGDAWRGLAAFVTALVIYLGMMWGVGRYVITPYRVAMRAKPFLKNIYADGASKKPNSREAP